MDWTRNLPNAPLNWLLEAANPSVRWFALTELLDVDTGDEQAREARQGIADASYAAQILAGQTPEGYWGRPERCFQKHTGTAWRWLLLHELGLDPQHPQMLKAAAVPLDIADNVAPFYMSADHEAPEKRIFKAVGFDCEWVDKERGHDEAVFRQQIAESIQRGMPVLGYGVVSPPEASIIAGYDDGGDTLIGWSFFQDPHGEQEPPAKGQPYGYFRQRDWFENTMALLVIGDKVERPSTKVSCREALQWMLHVTRTPMVRPEEDAPEHYRNRHNGLAAYKAWAAHLLNDKAWPADDEGVLRAHHQVHNDAVGAVAEARWYGSVFLVQFSKALRLAPRGPAGRPTSCTPQRAMPPSTI